MAHERAWAQGYLAQARADLEAVGALQGRAPSVLAMLLQMVFEKLGKAALLRNRSLTIDRAQSTHKSASPHLEYPWATQSGEIRWPAEHLGLVQRLADSRERVGPRVVRLAAELVQRFDALFPWGSGQNG